MSKYVETELPGEHAPDRRARTGMADALWQHDAGERVKRVVTDDRPAPVAALTASLERLAADSRADAATRLQAATALKMLLALASSPRTLS